MTIATKKFDRPVVGEIRGWEIIGRVSPVIPGAAVGVQKHYDRGREDAGGMDYITISGNNVWGGRSKSGGSVQSYEKIGYHTGAADWLVGALTTDCPVYAFCEDGWREVTL